MDRKSNVTPESERDAKKKRLAKILSVSERTVREWTSRIDKDAKEARNKRIFDLWMQCYSTDEIAEQTGTPRQTVNDAICPNLEGLPKSDKSAAEHATDFEPPIYNGLREDPPRCDWIARAKFYAQVSPPKTG